jgi:hypothetical protein
MGKTFAVYLLSKQGEGAEFFHLLHEKKVQGGAKLFLVHDRGIENCL